MSEDPFRRVAGDLRRRILAGEFAEGARLPSVRRLAEEYEISKGTAERAYARLRSQGLVASRPGAGYFVRRIDRIRRESPGRLARERREQGMSIQGHDDAGGRPRVVDVIIGDVVPPHDVADTLGVEPGVVVLSRARRFVMDGRTIQLATSYLPTELTRGTRMEHTDTGPGGLYGRLADSGFALTNFVERVVVRPVDPDEVGRLDLELDSQVVMEVTRRAFAGDRCVEVNVMIMDPTSYELVYSFPA